MLGIDYGSRRIGLALSDATGTLATPWRVLHAGAAGGVRAQIVHVVDELMSDSDGLGAVVVGWPRKLDGTPTHQTAAAEALAHMLERRLTIPVVLQDERLSSHEADLRLAERERDWRRRKALLDAASAAVILQDYLDHTRAIADRRAFESQEG